MSTLKKNIAYKGLLMFSNFIIVFITFPYVTRVLGPSNFGLVNFAMNTVDYFLLFATLGITSIGTREIASCRGDKERLSSAFSKILGVNLITTGITLIVFFIAVAVVPRFHENQDLMYIGSAKILFTAFAIEWFFTGIENFRYIAYRNLLVKVVYIISVFLLVKSEADYKLYFLLTILSVVISAVINFIYARNFVQWNWRESVSKTYFKQNLRLGVYAIMTSMYITFNVMYLGLVSTDLQVGYYSTAVKLYFIAVTLFSAFTSVMMPRISSLLAGGNRDLVDAYLMKSFALVFMLSLPIMIIAEFFAPIIIEVMSGAGYGQSVMPMRILMPALFFVWIAQVISVQALLPLRKDNILLAASLTGGVLAIVINLIVTPRLGAIGSSITLVCCEVAVTGIYVVASKRYKLIKLPSVKFFVWNIIKALPYLVIAYVIYRLNSGIIGIVCTTALSGLYFLSLKPLKMLRSI